MRQTTQTLNIETIAQLFLEMKARGLCYNDSEFSTTWLGLSPTYYRVSGESTSGMALFNCWDRLQSCGQFPLAAECFKLVRERCRVNARSESIRRGCKARNEAATA